MEDDKLFPELTPEQEEEVESLMCEFFDEEDSHRNDVAGLDEAVKNLLDRCSSENTRTKLLMLINMNSLIELSASHSMDTKLFGQEEADADLEQRIMEC